MRGHLYVETRIQRLHPEEQRPDQRCQRERRCDGDLRLALGSRDVICPAERVRFARNSHPKLTPLRRPGDDLEGARCRGVSSSAAHTRHYAIICNCRRAALARSSGVRRSMCWRAEVDAIACAPARLISFRGRQRIAAGTDGITGEQLNHDDIAGGTVARRSRQGRHPAVAGWLLAALPITAACAHAGPQSGHSILEK